MTVVCIEGCVPTYQLGSGFSVEEFSPSDRLDCDSNGSFYRGISSFRSDCPLGISRRFLDCLPGKFWFERRYFLL